MPTPLRNVGSQGQSGKHMLALSFSAFDPGCVKKLKKSKRDENDIFQFDFQVGFACKLGG
jgi:hypothetical protein